MRWGILVVPVAVAACVPAPRPVVSQVVPERPATLLRKLALDVPADVARLAIENAPPETAVVATAAPAFVDTARTVADAARARECLTAAIYYEARSETVDGQRAVAQVVLNRVRDRAFPKSVCGVVYQGSQRRTGCQFSFTCDGSLYRPRDPGSWGRAADIAESALAGSVYAPVGSATHYHTTAISPWWAPSLTRLTTVGAHVFYRWRGAMERALAFRQAYDGYEPEAGGGFSAPVPDGSIASYGTEQSHGVTIHRDGPAQETATVDQAPAPAARIVTVAGIRIHRGVDRSSAASGGVRVHRNAVMADQPSLSPMPIEARAESASLLTTGYAQ